MPDITPTFSDLTPSEFTNANVGGWYFGQSIGLVPDTVAPFLAAHGFIVNGGTEHYIDGEFAGYLLNMYRNKFDRMSAMQTLLNTMVFSFNEGRDLNQTRYEDLVSNLQTLLSNNQADVTSFLNNSVIDSATGYVTLLISSLDTLITDYEDHADTATDFLTNLGITELARINEQFDNLQTTQDQALVNRGFYSSALATQVTAQVDRERTQAIIELNDRLNREKFENQHRLYEQQFRMRMESIRVRQSTGDFHSQLIRYQLDQRSNLALALFGLVERREDDYPGVGDLAATVASMGDDQ
jgi:hypothetical protein